MSQSKKRIHHFVAQHYLRRFCDVDGQIYVLDKFKFKSGEKGNPFQTNPRNAACERDFNMLPEALGDVTVKPEGLEDFYSTIESDVDPEIGSVIKRAMLYVDRPMPYGGKLFLDLERAKIAYYIALQFTRTKEFRSIFEQMTEGLKEGLREKGEHIPIEKLDEFFSGAEPSAVQQVRMLANPEHMQKMVNLLSSHVWFIGYIPESLALYTSDHPVAISSHENHPGRGVGLGSYGVEIAFPLSSRFVLMMYDRGMFGNAFEGRENMVVRLTSENVVYVNAKQVQRSYRQIFCSVDDFSLARNICKKNPDVCDPNRKRVSLN